MEGGDQRCRQSDAINVVNCPGIVLDGFEVSGARASGVSMNTDFGTVRNCWVHNNDHMGIPRTDHRGVRIEANLIEFNGCNIQFHHGVYADGEGLTGVPQHRPAQLGLWAAPVPVHQGCHGEPEPGLRTRLTSQGSSSPARRAAAGT